MKLVVQFDRKNEDLLDSMKQQVSEISLSQKELTISTNSELKRYRDEITHFRREFNKLAKKEEFVKAHQMIQETRVTFTSHLDLMKAELKASLGRIEKFTKSVT